MINVLFFGRVADLMRQRNLQVAAEDCRSIFALRDAIFQTLFAEGTIGPESIRMSVNQGLTSSDIAVSDGDEVAFFSVFSGG